MMHSHGSVANLRASSLAVLILVVMDDALAQKGNLEEGYQVRRLNPCCNG